MSIQKREREVHIEREREIGRLRERKKNEKSRGKHLRKRGG